MLFVSLYILRILIYSLICIYIYIHVVVYVFLIYLEICFNVYCVLYVYIQYIYTHTCLYIYIYIHVYMHSCVVKYAIYIHVYVISQYVWYVWLLQMCICTRCDWNILYIIHRSWLGKARATKTHRFIRTIPVGSFHCCRTVVFNRLPGPRVFPGSPRLGVCTLTLDP